MNLNIVKSVLIFTTMLISVGCVSTSKFDVSELVSKANGGDAFSQNDLGSRYQFGDGVSKDYIKAIEFYKKASNQGFLLATVNLGYMYDLGLGVKEDDVKAKELYITAANGNHPRGMLNLGLMSADDKNYSKAYMWLELSRFYSQNSKDKQVKWASRGALDKLKGFISKEDISKGKLLAKNWISQQ